MKKVILVIAGLTLISLFACSKKEGPQGPAGTNGTNGLDGNANVYYSEWAMLGQAWRDTTIDGSLLKYNYILASVLNQNMIDSAAVLVYMKFADQIHPLPYTSYAGGIANTMGYFMGLGKIYLTRFTHDNSGSIGASSVLQFRYVVIPGGIVSYSALKQMKYEEIISRYNIAE